MNKYRQWILPAVISTLVVIAFAGCSKPQNNNEINAGLLSQLKAKQILLPNGWSLSPAGHSLRLGDLPLNMALSHSGRLLAVTNNGYGKQEITLVDTKSQTLLDSAEVSIAWVGLKFGAGDSLLYASGGNNSDILIFRVKNDKLVRADSIALGKPWPKNKISVGGLDVDNVHHRLYAVTIEDSSLYVVNLTNKSVRRVHLKNEAYTCLLSPDRHYLYISLWGGGKVDIYDTQNQRMIKSITVESHPNEMAITPDGRYLYVSNANSNSVSVINTGNDKVIETLNTALFPDSPAGSTPNGLALDPSTSRLYVANANNDCLAVFDVSKPGDSRSLGFIPTGWYPTSVKVANGHIFVANGKGEHSAANPKGPNPYDKMTKKTQYIGGLFLGTLSIINQPTQSDLAAYSQAVYNDTPYSPKKDTLNHPESNPVPAKIGGASPIKHVFYIIKENRTYDQVLGDMKEGNGDSTLTLFGRNVTPNEHALAADFVLLDNFYVNSEVSADGHNWSTAAYATDYVEKTWPTNYSGRGGTYDYEGSRDITYPAKGFIWNYCKRAGVSYRSYGEFADLGKTHLKVLKGHLDIHYPGFNLNIKDVKRERLWEHDFDSLLAKHAVPAFQTIRLPNDHTSGATPGEPTPDAYAADNDLALGRLIDHLSHSSIWKESVVFVVEDDAQDGPDHVDAHRSTCYVIGPYVKRHQLVHTMYSTASVLRTIELILGLPPMSQYDAAATPMYDCFTNTPDDAPYIVKPNRINLNKLNVAINSLSRENAKFDLSRADAAPDVAFNEVIWKVVKGINSVMPAPRHSAFVRTVTGKLVPDDDGD